MSSFSALSQTTAWYSFALAVGVLGGGLGLAHSAQAGQRVAARLLQRRLEVAELRPALGEERILRQRNHEDGVGLSWRRVRTRTRSNAPNAANETVQSIGVVDAVS